MFPPSRLSCFCLRAVFGEMRVSCPAWGSCWWQGEASGNWHKPQFDRMPRAINPPSKWSPHRGVGNRFSPILFLTWCHHSLLKDLHERCWIVKQISRKKRGSEFASLVSSAELRKVLGEFRVEVSVNVEFLRIYSGGAEKTILSVCACCLFTGYSV